MEKSKKLVKDISSIVWLNCAGEAHSMLFGNDHCLVCSPYWEYYPTCPDCGQKLTNTRNKYKCERCRLSFV